MSSYDLAENYQTSRSPSQPYVDPFSQPLKKRKFLYKTEEPESPLIGNMNSPERAVEEKDSGTCLTPPSPLSPVCSYGLSTPSLPVSPSYFGESFSSVFERATTSDGDSPESPATITSTDRLNLIKAVATLNLGIMSPIPSPATLPPRSSQPTPAPIPLRPSPVPIGFGLNSPFSPPFIAIPSPFSPTSSTNDANRPVPCPCAFCHQCRMQLYYYNANKAVVCSCGNPLCQAFRTLPPYYPFRPFFPWST